MCIPETVREEVRAVLEAALTFLEEGSQMDFTEVALLSRCHSLALNGHIPFPGTLTEWSQLLGTYDTSSLP